MSCICSFNLNENSERVFMVCPESMRNFLPHVFGCRTVGGRRFGIGAGGVSFEKWYLLLCVCLSCLDLFASRYTYDEGGLWTQGQWNRIPTKQKRLLQLSNKYKCIRSVPMVMQRDATVYFSAETQTPYVRGVIGGVFVCSRWGCVSVVRRGFTFPGGSVEKSLTHVVQMHFMKEAYTGAGMECGEEIWKPDKYVCKHWKYANRPNISNDWRCGQVRGVFHYALVIAGLKQRNTIYGLIG